MRKGIQEYWLRHATIFKKTVSDGKDPVAEMQRIIEKRRPDLFKQLECFIQNLKDNLIEEVDFLDFATQRLIFCPTSCAYVISDEELLEYRAQFFAALESNTSVHTIRFVSIPMGGSDIEWAKVFNAESNLRHVTFYSCGLEDNDASQLSKLKAVKEGRVVLNFLEEKFLSPLEGLRVSSRVHVEPGDEDLIGSSRPRAHSF